MPFKSKAQAAYFNSHKSTLQKEGVNVEEWNQASKGLKLPQKKAQASGPKGSLLNAVRSGRR